jgi:nitroimidazol reductase NimA-like FMN-containing flavoprotein (pyridoxamine 5'-phosphate oxidase superfamily)
MAQRVIVEMEREECLSLLHQGRVGRLAYSDHLGPVAVPVNFALAGDDVVIRREATNLPADFDGSFVAFEIDGTDPEADQGWSVIVRGPVRQLVTDEVPALLRELSEGPPRPWADGVHNVWFRLTTEIVTGRRLGSYSTPLVI